MQIDASWAGRETAIANIPVLFHLHREPLSAQGGSCRCAALLQVAAACLMAERRMAVEGEGARGQHQSTAV